MSGDVLADAEALVERAKAVSHRCQHQFRCDEENPLACAACGSVVHRMRLDADLAGLRRALDGLARHKHGDNDRCYRCRDAPRWPCPDTESWTAERDARLASIRDTAALYGVQP